MASKFWGVEFFFSGHVPKSFVQSDNHPSGALVWTRELTQIVATFIAMYGVFMTSIVWKLAGFIWAYALIWFLLNVHVKVQMFHLISSASLPDRRHVNRIETPLHPGPDR